MFGKRSDGKTMKTIDPIFKLIPHIMTERHDAQNSLVLSVRCEYLDAYIAGMRQQGISMNYMHIIIAGIVRLFALKPHLNRFIMNRRIYKRKGIYVSFAVKKSLKEEADETTIKLGFTGTENIFEIRDRINKAIEDNCSEKAKNNTDKTAKRFTSLPTCLIKAAIGLVKVLDKHGMLPKSLIEVSPFHTSCFVTNLKSIHMDYIYHHLYDFGTTGMFVSIGKEKEEPVVNDDNQLEIGKVMKLGVVADERLCDGFYHANSLRLFQKLIKDPKQLETKLDDIVHDAD